MSYNPAYGQPQAQMGMQLPFPTTQFVAQMYPVQPGQPPVLPQISYLPPALQQFYPFIVSSAIDAIQAKAQANPLRVFLFNQMAQNNFNNLEFTSFVEGLVRLIEVKLGTGVFRDVQQAAVSCATYYAELATAANVDKYPALLQGMDQQTLQGVQQVLNNLRATTGEIQMFYQRAPQMQPQQMGMMPGAMGGMPGGQWPQNQPMHQPMHQPMMGRGVDWRQAQHQQNLAAGAVGAVSTAEGYTSASGYGGNIFTSGDPVAARYDNANRPGSPRAASHVQNVHDARRAFSNPPGNLPPPPPPPAPATGTRIAAKAPGAVWVPSETAPVNVAYDHTAGDVYYQSTPDGKMKPVIQPKAESDMDMSKHLTTPSFVHTAPAGLDTLDTKARVMETERSLSEDALKLGDLEAVDKLQVVYKDASFRTDISMEDLWLSNEVELALMKKSTKRTSLYRQCAAHLTPLVSRVNPKSMVNTIAQAASFEAACKAMLNYIEQFKEGKFDHGDQKALTFINKRLTERLNSYLKKVLAVPVQVESFMEDAPGVPQYLRDKYGPNFGRVMAESQGDLVSQALLYVEEEFERQQNTNLFTDEEIEKIQGAVTVTYFYDYITLTSLDLLAPELKFDVPQTDISVGIFAAQTPLLRQIADNVFTHERTLDMTFDRHLVRTADGVTLELTKSPMMSDTYLVCIADD